MIGLRRTGNTAIGLLCAVILPWSALATDEVQSASITLSGYPAGVDIYLDGSWIGTTSGHPFHIANLAPGSYQLVTRKEGWPQRRFTADVSAGQSLVIQEASPTPKAAMEQSVSSPAPARGRTAPVSRPRATASSTSAAVETAPAPAATPIPQRTPEVLESSILSARPNATILLLLAFLAIVLVAGFSWLAYRMQRTGAGTSPESPDSVPDGTPTTTALSDAAPVEPEFFERLRFRESLVRQGFTPAKSIPESSVVLDIDTYEVGKDI